jgi:iron(III) transport system substrate-binding protein
VTRARIIGAVLATTVCMLASVVSGCSGGDSKALTIYSGRSEELIGPLIERFQAETGIKTDVLYGDSASLALQLAEERGDSPADVFFSQAPGPLGLVDGREGFQPLPSELTSRVAESYRATDQEWVGVSARVRVLVYDPERVPLASLPGSVLDLADPASELSVAIAPTNASFQDFVSALRLDLGESAALLFLDGLAENGVRTYPNNVAIVEAVGRGEVDVGLVNHYYNLELRAQDGSLATENYFFGPGDLGSMVLVSGVAVLDTADDTDAARRFVEFLLADESQQFFASQTFEYPLANGLAGPAGQPSLATFATKPIDLVLLGQQLSSTLTLIEQSGLIG